MKLLQHALGDDEMQLVFSCMDSHGYITPEQVRHITQEMQLQLLALVVVLSQLGADQMCPRQLQAILATCSCRLHSSLLVVCILTVGMSFQHRQPSRTHAGSMSCNSDVVLQVLLGLTPTVFTPTSCLPALAVCGYRPG